MLALPFSASRYDAIRCSSTRAASEGDRLCDLLASYLEKLEPKAVKLSIGSCMVYCATPKARKGPCSVPSLTRVIMSLTLEGPAGHAR